MRQLFFIIIPFVIAWAFAACKDSQPGEPTEEEPGAAEETAPPIEPELAYLTSITGLRHKATTDRKVEIEPGKAVNNWQMTLYRGEELTVVKVEGEWAKVRASDDSEGWVQKEYLLPTEGVSVATVFEEVKTFSRPDLLALNSSLTLEPGTLLFVLKSKEQFTEVNRFGQRTTWVLSEKLNSEAPEVSAAKLLNKAKWLEKRKDPSAAQVFELARTQFGETRLAGMLEEQEAADQPAQEAPAEGEPTGEP